jgi:hypothetical protein
MELAGFYREKAEQCERLARGVADERTRTTLAALHEEYAERAQGFGRGDAAEPRAGSVRPSARVSGIRDPATLREAAARCLRAADALPSGAASDALRAAHADYVRWAEGIEEIRDSERITLRAEG